VALAKEGMLRRGFAKAGEDATAVKPWSFTGICDCFCRQGTGFHELSTPA